MARNVSVFGLLALLLMLPAAHAARDFPDNARRGTITAHQYPYYRIGSDSFRMSPAGRIYNEHNLIIVPVSLPPRRAEIMYQLDFSGALSKIWLLTAEEVALHPKPAEPRRPVNAGGR